MRRISPLGHPHARNGGGSYSSCVYICRAGQHSNPSFRRSTTFFQIWTDVLRLRNPSSLHSQCAGFLRSVTLTLEMAEGVTLLAFTYVERGNTAIRHFEGARFSCKSGPMSCD